MEGLRWYFAVNGLLVSHDHCCSAGGLSTCFLLLTHTLKRISVIDQLSNLGVVSNNHVAGLYIEDSEWIGRNEPGVSLASLSVTAAS